MIVAKMKYVLNADTNEFVLFPASTRHKDIKGNWTHAGFVNLDVKEEHVVGVVFR